MATPRSKKHVAPARSKPAVVRGSRRLQARRPRRAIDKVYASLLANMPGEVYRCRNDRDWTMEYVSQGVLDLTGYPPDDFLSGRVKFGDLIHPEDAGGAWDASQAALARREPYTLEYRIRARDGAEKWVWERGSGIFDRKGAVVALEGFVGDVTGRKNAERLLAESEARFRDFAQASGDWFWETDAQNRYCWFSGNLEQVVGQPPGFYLGRDRFEVAAAAGAGLDAEPWKSHLAAIARREPFRNFLHRRVTPTGEYWLNVSGMPRFDAKGVFLGYRAAVSNVTVPVLAERRARAADERLGTALDALNEAIVVTDAEDRIVVANRYFRSLNGDTDTALPGRLYEEHLRAGIAAGNFPGARRNPQEWLAKRLASRRLGGTTEVRRQDGRWLQVTDQRLADGGTITIGLDVTARKKSEVALHDLNVELEARVAQRTLELKTAYQELESFSYSVSHDLRAPLRAISGFAGILREDEGGRLSEVGLRHLKTIDASAQQMGRLVDALLELVRTSRQAIAGSRLDMTRIARDVADQLRAEYPRARLEIGEMPPAIGDAKLVRQVYANLIGNALKYSSQQDAPRVDVGAEHLEAGTVYFVRDNGIGFDMRYIGKLFKPFERLHSDAAFEGAGIGLALASLIVHRHGGRIEAESAPGQGATFRFTLGGP